MVFAKSGAGKSFTVKLEALRSMIRLEQKFLLLTERTNTKKCVMLLVVLTFV